MRSLSSVAKKPATLIRHVLGSTSATTTSKDHRERGRLSTIYVHGKGRSTYCTEGVGEPAKKKKKTCMHAVQPLHGIVLRKLSVRERLRAEMGVSLRHVRKVRIPT